MKVIRPIGVVLLITASSLIGLPASAYALVTHSYISAITGIKEEVGVAVPGPLGQINAMTASGGALWIAEASEGASFSARSRVDGITVPETHTTQLAEGPGVEELYGGIATGKVAGETQVYVGGQSAPHVGALFVFESSASKPAVWTGSDTPGPLGSLGERIAGVARDGSEQAGDWAKGDVYISIGEQNVIDVFKPEAGGKEKYVTQILGVSPGEPSFSGELPAERFINASKIAVDNKTGALLVVDSREGEPLVDVLQPQGVVGEYRLVLQLKGTELGAFTPFPQIENIAVDGSDGEIYVSLRAGETSTIAQFSESGETLGLIAGTPTASGSGIAPFGGVTGIAVDESTHDVYVGDLRPPIIKTGETQTPRVDIFGPDIVLPDVRTDPVTEFGSRAARLAGEVTTHEAGAAKCHFAWGLAGELARTAPCEPEEVPNGAATEGVHSSLNGLEPDTAYDVHLEASNQNGINAGEGQEPIAFTTEGPGLHGAWASNVTSETATLSARVNPHGRATYYYFKYGLTTAYESDVPASSGGAAPKVFVGQNEGDVNVSQAIDALAPGATYHYRLIVLSETPAGEMETFESADKVLVTDQNGSGTLASVGGLADGRQWEMVSPVNKYGASLEPITEAGVAQSAESGDAMTYLANDPTETQPHGYADRVQILSQRGATGWTSQDVATRHATSTGIALNRGYEYRFFSPNLTEAIVEPQGEFTPLTGEEVAPVAAERTVYRRDNAICALVPSSCFRALVTSANTRPGTEINGPSTERQGLVRFQDASQNLEAVVVKATTPLTAAPGDVGGLYAWANGELQLISVSNSGPTANAELGYGTTGITRNARGAISADGSQVVWSAKNSGATEEELYAWDAASDTNTRLDVAQAGVKSGPSQNEARFEAASSDGTRIFFKDSAPLTSGASGTDLYVCEMSEVAQKRVCGLNEVAPDVQGTIPGISEDGTYVYYVSTAALTGSAVEGGDNLYVSHNVNGQWQRSFIVTLGTGDDHDWAGSEVEGKYLAGLTARVAPNGKYFAFMSAQPLTGYDTDDAVTGEPDQEVYMYDASTATLVCPSCNPTGARPEGTKSGALGEERLFEGSAVWSPETPIAGSIPGWTPFGLAQALYQSRYLSSSGRLFFDSSDALVPQDGNGAMDVYEFEPSGVGGCKPSGATFVVADDGCIGLISSGTSSEESVFLDASESGGDVFFLTASRLSNADVDNSYDVYDAHECTPEAPCLKEAPVAPAPCSSGDSCRPAPAEQPPIFGPPPTSTFSGAGNVAPAVAKPLTRTQKLDAALKRCAKMGRRKRAACRAQARRRYAPPRKKAHGALFGVAKVSPSANAGRGGGR